MNQPLRVLIVEDSESDALLLLRELRRGGYEPSSQRVESAATLTAALAAQEWDVVISDYRLPQFTGLDALKLVQETGRDLPFILVSGVIGEELAVTMMKAGAHDYVLKDRLARLAPVVNRELGDAEVRRQCRLAEETLRQSEAQFRLLFEANPNSMWVFDEETLQFLAVNIAAVRQYGYSVEEFLARTIFEIGPPEDRDQVRAIVAKQLGVTSARIGIFRHCKKDGTVMEVEIVAGSISFTGRPGRLVLATDVTDRLRAERALQEAHDSLEQRVQERTAQLQHELDERRRLETAIPKVAEDEQRRLGSALHDGVGQYMSALNLLTGAMEKRLVKRRSVEVRELSKIRSHLDETFHLTRQLARGLYASDVDREGLPTALDLLAGNITELFQIPCEYLQEQLITLTESEVSRQLFRIAQEAATNAAKHSRCKRITIGLRVTSGQLTLTVADDGHGLRSTRNQSSGMGLAIMRYRAQNIGATLEILRRPSGGTEVICVVPAAPAARGTTS